jgi:hypothetical protein
MIQMREVEARFGNKADLHPFVKRMRRLNKKGSNEPYSYGDFGNVLWGNRSKIWNDPFPVPCWNVKYTGIIGSQVASGGNDPLAWIDSKYRCSFKAIKESLGKPLDIHTRSDLVAREDYIEVIDPQYHTVYMHIPNMPYDILRIVEPGTASVERRIEAIKRLVEAGIMVVVVLDVIKEITKKSCIHEDLIGLGVEFKLNEIELTSLSASRIKKKCGFIEPNSRRRR